MRGMTDRDHFAAAALAGFASQLRYGSVFNLTLTAKQCYELADAMLRERERTNLDAAPAARADLPDERPPHAVSASGGTPSAASRDGSGTGDTQSFDAYRRFVGEVMNWISEATSAADCSSDGGRKIMADACSRCWDAFDRIAYPTVHGASPEARAESDEDRADKAATSHRRDGTGDTPKPISGCVSDRPTPITGPDPDSRVWETHTPATHATHGEGSVPREGAEPEAWAVCTPGDGDWSPCFFHEPHAQRCASAIFGSKNIVPLYRSPTLTDAEVTFLRRERDLLDADDEGDRKTLEIIAGLLERMGGGR